MDKKLTQTLISATGLPETPVERELLSLLERNGKSPDTLTLDELREVMAEYLQIVFLELHGDEKSA